MQAIGGAERDPMLQRRESLFWLVLGLWVVGAPGWYWAVPALLAAWFGLPPDLPIGVRLALVAAWLTGVFVVLGLVNLVRRLANQDTFDLMVPPALAAWLPIPRAWRSWVLGGVAVAIGYLIGTTIFR